jgi:hypothetical protein
MFVSLAQYKRTREENSPRDDPQGGHGNRERLATEKLSEHQSTEREVCDVGQLVHQHLALPSRQSYHVELRARVRSASEQRAGPESSENGRRQSGEIAKAAIPLHTIGRKSCNSV